MAAVVRSPFVVVAEIMAQSLKNMLGAGMGVNTAVLINGTAVDGLTATGSNQAGAFQLTSDINVVTTVPAGTGVRLAPIPLPGDETVVVNLGTNALNVYPGIGGTIQVGSLNAPYILSAGASASFAARLGSENWIVLSSGGSLGAGSQTGIFNFSQSANSGLITLLEDF